MEFFRPQATRSCTRDRTMLRRAASSKVASPCFELSSSGLVMEKIIDSLSASGAVVPIQSTNAPEIYQGRHKDAHEDHRFPERRPSQRPCRNRPGKEEHRFDVEDDEEHCHQVELCREPYVSGAFREDA